MATAAKLPTYTRTQPVSDPPTQRELVQSEAETAKSFDELLRYAQTTFVPKGSAAQADSTAAALADLVTDFNALLAKLRALGVLAP